jgi:hypothetical protein
VVGGFWGVRSGVRAGGLSLPLEDSSVEERRRCALGMGEGGVWGEGGVKREREVW